MEGEQPPKPGPKDKIKLALGRLRGNSPAAPAGEDQEPLSSPKSVQKKAPLVAESAEQAAIVKENAERLRGALESLTPKQRMVIELMDLQGLSAAEAARKLGVTDEDVRTLHTRARQSMKSYLKGH